MRRLVTLRTVRDILPIAGADNIELAIVDGWQCVVKKGEFRAGDPGLYFEIDALLPDSDARFAFLAKHGVKRNPDGRTGYRLRTVRLRGVLSQGLLLPMRDFPEIVPDDEYAEALDDQLGVVKWEPHVSAALGGNPRGNFPAFVPKTDQERIQNATFILGDENLYEVTLKLDGSSMTVYHRDGEMGVCSRNINLQEDEGNTFWAVARMLNLPERIAALGNFAVQGELMGPGIQGNRENLPAHDLYVFDVFDIDAQRYLLPPERIQFMAHLNAMDGPVVNSCPLVMMASPAEISRGDINRMLDHATGPSLFNNTREGVVWKHMSVPGASFKVISNEFLLTEV